ncbi:MAG: hypothetical protein V1820_03395 [archaeon]
MLGLVNLILLLFVVVFIAPAFLSTLFVIELGEKTVEEIRTKTYPQRKYWNDD